MRKKNFRGPVAYSSCLPLMALLMAPQLHSQESQTRTSNLEEVIVTAQKRDQMLQDVPIAVSAFSADALADSGVGGQVDLARVTPNLSFNVSAAFASIYLRGIGTTFANPGLEQSVSVYLDDIYIPRANNGLMGFVDVERVEVLKGPQGTLYGRNATGGAIRIVTKDPTREFSGKASVTTGSFDRFGADGAINIPMGDIAAARFSASHNRDDGYVRNHAAGAQSRLMDNNDQIVTGKLLIEPTDELLIKFGADYERKDGSNASAFLNLFDGTDQIGAALGGCVSTSFHTGCNDMGANGKSRPIVIETESWGANVRVDYEINAGTFSSITSYRKDDQVNAADLDATGIELQHSMSDADTSQITQEFQFISSEEGPLNYVAGLFYYYEKASLDFGVFGLGVDQQVGFANASLKSSGEVETNSIAPYAQLDWEIDDQWSLAAGLRYTAEEKKMVYSRGSFGVRDAEGYPGVGEVVAPFGSCGTDINAFLCDAPKTDQTFEELTPKLTLSYRPVDHVLLYGTYSKGFKSGGNSLPSFGIPYSVDPEILTNYELGMKTQFTDVIVNASLFYYDYEDLQIQVTNQGTGQPTALNAAAADIWGFESDVTWAPTPDLQFGAGVGYLHSEYKDFQGDLYYRCSTLPTDPGCAARGGVGIAVVKGDLTGNELANAPDLTVYLKAQYTLTLPDSAGSLIFSPSVNYRSEAYFDTGNQLEDEARTMLAAKITWKSVDEKYFVALAGENLTDREYDTSQIPQATGGWRVPGAPRTYSLQAGVNFE